MCTSSITMSAAGIMDMLVADNDLIINPTNFRGFATTTDSIPMLNVEIKKCQQQQPGYDKCIDVFVGDCRDAEVPAHRWEIGNLPDGQEYISINYYTEQVPFEWIRLTFGATDGVLEVVFRDRNQKFIDPYIFPLTNILISRLLRRFHSFLIHSSVVDDGGKGYLFTAVSGTGKSTMARLWQSKGARIINDDMIAIRTDAESICAMNIPMPYYVDAQRSVTLNGIFLISQSKTNFVRKISGAQAILRLASNTISQPTNQKVAIEHINNVSKVAQQVPIFEAGFKPDTDIVTIIRDLNL